MHTFLTEAWGLRVPIVGAPMSPQAGGRLAAAISIAGGLGMIGVGARQSTSDLERDVTEYKSLAGERPFGIGLMVWALDARPELLETAIAARPFAISLSFGNPSTHARRVRDAGIALVSQVQDRQSALEAEAAGAAVVVAQGTEAGGHTGGVGTLPLLQIVLEAVRTPVVAAGGIASGRGLAAVLAAGAEGAWIGTPFLLADEARNSAQARQRLIEARETGTVLTSAFDVAQSIPWPPQFRGRALTNEFSERWTGREAELARDTDALRAFEQARQASPSATPLFLYAGQSVGLATRVEPAGDMVRRIEVEAEDRLRLAARLVDSL